MKVYVLSKVSFDATNHAKTHVKNEHMYANKQNYSKGCVSRSGFCTLKKTFKGIYFQPCTFRIWCRFLEKHCLLFMNRKDMIWPKHVSAWIFQKSVFVRNNVDMDVMFCIDSEYPIRKSVTRRNIELSSKTEVFLVVSISQFFESCQNKNSSHRVFVAINTSLSNYGDVHS